jgi:phage terminase small subunit
MRQRGRKSGASHVALVVDIAQQRPQPPKALSREGKQVWREIVDRLRPDWFQGSEFLLEILCRAVVLERWLCQQIKAADPKDEKRLAALVQMQKAEAMVIGNLSGKLRLTPRSSFDRYTPKLVSTGDGAVARACRETVRKYWRAPDLSRSKDVSKYR